MASAARRKLQGLRRALRGSPRCTFLLQHDPDPDAIASALALRAALGLRVSAAPIVTCGKITRPENRRLIAELGVRVGHISAHGLHAAQPLVLVDVQPSYFDGLLHSVAAVVDHHPPAGTYRARFRDVRPSYGASATIAAQYLLAENEELLTQPLATALLYGIITDTKSLSRSASDDDLQMFAFLFPRADHALLRRIQHPSYPPLVLERFGLALRRARVQDGIAYVHLGRLPEEQQHVVAQLAEFCIGMEGAEVAAVSGVFGEKLVMSVRALWPAARLGERLHDAFRAYGSAGGHAVMAKAVVNLPEWQRAHRVRGDRALEKSIASALRRTFKKRTRKAKLSAVSARGLGGRQAGSWLTAGSPEADS